MPDTVTEPAAGTRAGYVLRVTALVVTIPAVGYWLLFASVLWVIRCGDSCSSVAQTDRWQYTGQLVVALVGAGSVLAALIAGVTGAKLAERRLLLVAGPCTVGWLLWVLAFGTF